MKKKIGLKTTPDFLTRYTEGLWQRTRECIAATGGIIPTLSYIRNGREFSMPINYEALVGIGIGMNRFNLAAQYTQAMGPEFGFLAMQLAERAEDPAFMAEDRKRFVLDVGHVLAQTCPEAFFLSMPVMIVKGVFSPGGAAAALAAGKKPTNAIMVVGRNMIRSYSLITPVLGGEDGVVRYGKQTKMDSLSGKVQECGLFASIYDPSTN